jgi:hypothetical protein
LVSSGVEVAIGAFVFTLKLVALLTGAMASSEMMGVVDGTQGVRVLIVAPAFADDCEALRVKTVWELPVAVM